MKQSIKLVFILTLSLINLSVTSESMAQGKYYTKRGDRYYNAGLYDSAYREYMNGVKAGEVGSAEAIFTGYFYDYLMPVDYKAAERMIEKWYKKSESICIFAAWAYLPKEYRVIEKFFYHTPDSPYSLDIHGILSGMYSSIYANSNFQDYYHGPFFSQADDTGWKPNMALAMKYFSYWEKEFASVFERDRSTYLSRSCHYSASCLVKGLQGLCYEKGIGGYPKDRDKAFEMYSQAQAAINEIDKSRGIYPLFRMEQERQNPEQERLKQEQERKDLIRREADAYRDGTNGYAKDLSKALDLYKQLNDQKAVNDLLRNAIVSSDLKENYNHYSPGFRNELDRFFIEYSSPNSSDPVHDARAPFFLDKYGSEYPNESVRQLIKERYCDYYHTLPNNVWSKRVEMKKLRAFMSDYEPFQDLYDTVTQECRASLQSDYEKATKYMISRFLQGADNNDPFLYDLVKNRELSNPDLHAEFAGPSAELDRLYTITEDAYRVKKDNITSVLSFLEQWPESPYTDYFKTIRDDLFDKAAYDAAQKLTKKSSKDEINAVLSLPMTDPTREIITKYASKKGLNLKAKYEKKGVSRSIEQIASEIN